MRVGDREELFTHVAAPVMTRLRQPERLVLDTLVDAGVARSRADALAWCVRLVGQHERTGSASCARRWGRSTSSAARARRSDPVVVDARTGAENSVSCPRVAALGSAP